MKGFLGPLLRVRLRKVRLCFLRRVSTTPSVRVCTREREGTLMMSIKNPLIGHTRRERENSVVLFYLFGLTKVIFPMDFMKFENNCYLMNRV